jgi:N-acetylmuramoyl-L-alanine amidase
MNAVEELCRDILARRKIPARHVLGHSDVAPERKQDPGELFDWPRLARAGIGLWPGAAPPAPAGTVAGLLQLVGYDPKAPIETVVAAFQRHFRPARVDGVADEETRKILVGVASLCGAR